MLITPKSGLSSDNTMSDSQSKKPTFLFFLLLCLSSKHICVSHDKQDWETDEAAKELCPWSPTSSYRNHSLNTGCPGGQDPVTIPAQRHLSSSNTSTQEPQSLSYSSHRLICHPKYLSTPTHNSTRNLPSTRWQYWQRRAGTALLSSLLGLISTFLILLQASQINATLF